VRLEEGEGGDQRVRLWTTHPGRLVLHWGVEGGRDYRGGWRLPGREAWPEGTVQYKERALQTNWRCGSSPTALHAGRYDGFACQHRPIASTP